jgi:hypothetical protein
VFQITLRTSLLVLLLLFCCCCYYCYGHSLLLVNELQHQLLEKHL